ncbi:MAG: ammonium transporter [Kineosporiaceae bacterium]|jgi:ammonium transporter, Amt family
MNTGDTAWVLTSAALVLLMTPGLAFFYGGMVRGKNVLNMLMMNYITIAVAGVLWVLVGYTLAFSEGGGLNKFVGGFDNLGLSGTVGELSGTIPLLAFVAFQGMFAIITPALFTGSIADRMKFLPFLIIVAVWSLLVYAPVAHWVWGGGWLSDLGAEDFAGGTVVHANAGAAGLALAIVLGKRKGWPKEPMRPHNLPFVLLGAALLWFGWFGFNAGSELAADDTAAIAFVTTNAATAAAMLGWVLVEKLRDGHPTTLGAASGAVIGLVAITPACAFVTPVGAIILGLIVGVIGAYAVGLKYKLGYDDALDVVGVHLVGGVLGALLIGFLGTSAIGGEDGLFYGGGAAQLGKQAIAVGATVVYSFVVTFILAKVVALLFGGLRVDEDTEVEGLDINLHAETAYESGTVATGRGPIPTAEARGTKEVSA